MNDRGRIDYLTAGLWTFLLCVWLTIWIPWALLVWCVSGLKAVVGFVLKHCAILPGEYFSYRARFSLEKYRKKKQINRRV